MNPLQKPFVLTLIAAAACAQATEFKVGDGVDARLEATATLGTMIRTDAPNPAVYGYIPSSVVPGAPQGRILGQTGGSDLNYDKGHAVSTVLKGLFDFDAHTRDVGVFVRASVWHDFVLGKASAAYGNYPNGYATHAPLSDAGIRSDAKFDGAMFRDAYVHAAVDAGASGKIQASLGRQVLNWGASQFVTGGINSAINPLDLAAQARPGALPQENKVPLGMLSVRLADNASWGVDAFMPYESRIAELPACGTFFDVGSIFVPGCNLGSALAAPIPGTPVPTIASLTEASLLNSGYYVHRNADVQASKSGHFGLSGRYQFAAIQTDVRAYFLNMPSTSPTFLQLTIENVAGATLPGGLGGGLARLTNPNGLKYEVVQPDNIRLFGLSFDTKVNAGTRVFGELAYRPNQPIGLNTNDLLSAALLRSPTALIQQHSNILAVPAGGTFNSWDSFKVGTGSVGINQVVPKVLGADRLVLAAEYGFSHVAGLPDPQTMRYGRAFAYGSAPYLLNGGLTACSEATPGLSGVVGKTCTTDGFVTSNASGVRMRAAATYADALAGATLTPAIVVAYDISGYSYDGTFSKGRTLVRTEIRADWGKRYFAQLQYSRFSGGNYNLLVDRSNLMLAGGMQF